MNSRKLGAALLSLALTVGLMPSTALAVGENDLRAETPRIMASDAESGASEAAEAEADESNASTDSSASSDSTATDSDTSTDSDKKSLVNLATCDFVFTDALHKDEGTDTLYFTNGDTDTVTPAFSLFNGNAEVPSSDYTVTYEKVIGVSATGEETTETVKAPPFAAAGGADEGVCKYKVVVTANKETDFTGSATKRFTVVNSLNLHTSHVDAYFAKGATYRHSVSPTNSDYYVIPKSKVSTVLNSLVVLTGGEAGLYSAHNGTQVTTKNYSVSYYKATIGAAYGIESPSGTAAVGDPLSEAPSSAGAYVMVIQGQGIYSGSREILFDIQDKMKHVDVAPIGIQSHTGKAIEPTVTVTYNGEALQEGLDFTVTYKKNKKIGTAKAIIRGGYKVQDNATGTAIELSTCRFFSGKKTVTFEIVSGDASKDMYRMYNPNSGEHFYTASSYERSDLVKAGWKYEGIGWTAPTTSSVPVYRLYSGTDHHYTNSATERDNLVKAGWKYEGIGWYSDSDEGVALYRLFNPNVDPTAKRNNSGSHHYTMSKKERKQLVKTGWKYEGISWYGIE